MAHCREWDQHGHDQRRLRLVSTPRECTGGCRGIPAALGPFAQKSLPLNLGKDSKVGKAVKPFRVDWRKESQGKTVESRMRGSVIGERSIDGSNYKAK